MSGDSLTVNAGSVQQQQQTVRVATAEKEPSTLSKKAAAVAGAIFGFILAAGTAIFFAFKRPDLLPAVLRALDPKLYVGIVAAIGTLFGAVLGTAIAAVSNRTKASAAV